MPATLRITLPECTPAPDQIEIKTYINGAPLFTNSVAGGTPHFDFTAYYYPSSTYTATARPIYSPIPCQLGAV